ncbi:MAG: hypothetical protein MRERV_18c004 [Mycoplasmataceae bacterium RV_VA103A]|nr:MAG: hypothetical protein MRERV_18c004 [Mycoplasmataceae bacterium RV_VA103A]
MISGILVYKKIMSKILCQELAKKKKKQNTH